MSSAVVYKRLLFPSCEPQRKKRKVEDTPGLVLADVPPGEAWDDPDMLPVRDKLNPKASRALRRSFVFLPHALADHPEEEERQQQEEQEENEDVDSEQQREEERGGMGQPFPIICAPPF